MIPEVDDCSGKSVNNRKFFMGHGELDTPVPWVRLNPWRVRKDRLSKITFNPSIQELNTSLFFGSRY